ncbi:unnamed protein product, partial [marine sediment metagenome]
FKISDMNQLLGQKNLKIYNHKNDDVFGILSNAVTCKDELVILKSKARSKCIEDGMDHEEFEEHWDYNIAGSKGKYSYSVVDDEISFDEIGMILDEDEDIINPPYSD